MQPRRRPHHGDLSAAGPRRKGAQCRIAGGLSARHQLSHLVYRAGADADPTFPAGATASRKQTAPIATGRRRSRRTASTRSFSSRSCSSMQRRNRGITHHQPDLGRGRRGAEDDGATRQFARPRHRRRRGASKCRYLIGCDGARSIVRKAIGAKLSGDAVIQRVQSTYHSRARADRPPAARTRLGHGLHQSAPRRHGVCDRWPRALAGAQLHEAGRGRISTRSIATGDPHHPRRRKTISNTRCISKEDWYGRRLIASRFRERCAFIAGDAAHIWVPYAGYGMNAGIADAMNLSWLLAAHLNGWAPACHLDAYEAERWPITEQVSRFAMSHARSRNPPARRGAGRHRGRRDPKASARERSRPAHL